MTNQTPQSPANPGEQKGAAPRDDAKTGNAGQDQSESKTQQQAQADEHRKQQDRPGDKQRI